MAARLTALLALAAACAATTANATAPPPDAAKLVLAPADFVSAKVASEGGSSARGYPVYMRTFRPGSKLGAHSLYSVASAVTVYPSAEKASEMLANGLDLYRTKRGRAKAAKALAAVYGGAAALIDALGGKKKPARRKPPPVRAVVGAPVPMGGGATRIPITLRLPSGTLRMDSALVRVDRALEEIAVAALIGQKVDLRDVARAVDAVRQRATAAFTVASAAPPAISGTPAQGQTLTAYPGDWTGGPTDFAYAWSRCDAAGAACAPVVGATASTYVPGPDDQGSTLRVTVTASNSVASQQATSPPFGIGVAPPATTTTPAPSPGSSS